MSRYVCGMANLIGNNPITAAGTYTLPVSPGQVYIFGASSAAWAGTLTVGWVDDAGIVVEFEESPLSANGGFGFVCPSGLISITTSATMTVKISVVPTL